MSTTSMTLDTSALCHAIKRAANLEPGDHVWRRGEVAATTPESKRRMYVEFNDGSVLPYDPREKVLCDPD